MTDVECPNISLLPAMAPLAYTSVTKNGTLKKNETAPPKIHVESTQVGGKVTYSCPPGYMIEGAKVAYCNDTGEWSAPMPLCKGIKSCVSCVFSSSYFLIFPNIGVTPFCL